jgi:hypothetical protein
MSDVLEDVESGRVARGELKIKETATVEKFEMTDQGRRLVEVVTAERRVDANTEDHGWTITRMSAENAR